MSLLGEVDMSDINHADRYADPKESTRISITRSN